MLYTDSQHSCTHFLCQSLASLDSTRQQSSCLNSQEWQSSKLSTTKPLSDMQSFSIKHPRTRRLHTRTGAPVIFLQRLRQKSRTRSDLALSTWHMSECINRCTGLWQYLSSIFDVEIAPNSNKIWREVLSHRKLFFIFSKVTTSLSNAVHIPHAEERVCVQRAGAAVAERTHSCTCTHAHTHSLTQTLILVKNVTSS